MQHVDSIRFETSDSYCDSFNTTHRDLLWVSLSSIGSRGVSLPAAFTHAFVHAATLPASFSRSVTYCFTSSCINSLYSISLRTVSPAPLRDTGDTLSMLLMRVRLGCPRHLYGVTTPTQKLCTQKRAHAGHARAMRGHFQDSLISNNLSRRHIWDMVIFHTKSNMQSKPVSHSLLFVCAGCTLRGIGAHRDDRPKGQQVAVSMRSLQTL